MPPSVVLRVKDFAQGATPFAGSRVNRLMSQIDGLRRLNGSPLVVEGHFRKGPAGHVETAQGPASFWCHITRLARSFIGPPTIDLIAATAATSGLQSRHLKSRPPQVSTS